MSLLSLEQIPFILDAYLASALPEFPIAFEGEEFTLPSTIWLRPLCQPGQLQGCELGSEGWSRRVGLYLVDIIAPGGTPAADAWAVAARVEELFGRLSRLDFFSFMNEQNEAGGMNVADELTGADGLQIEEPYTSNLGLNPQNAFQLRVTVPWWCWVA